MDDVLERLSESYAALLDAWARTATDAPIAVEEMSNAEMLAAHSSLVALRRQVDALQMRLVARIDHASRPELGSDSLARQNGYRSPVQLIAATTGAPAGEVTRLIAVGRATAPRTMLTGEQAPPRHPHVADAVRAGTIGKDAAAAIVRMLERLAVRASAEDRDAAEQLLCAQAARLPLDQLSKLIVRAEAHLDPDGIAPREDEARAKRHLRIVERDGLVLIDGAFDPEHAAPVVTVLQAIVTATYRADTRESSTSPVGPDGRSYPQRLADALSTVCQHYLDCDHTARPLGGATVIVRMTLDDLESGMATIDGITAPVSAGTARRMAAGGGIIPAVLDGGSEILDWGRQKRLFTPAQKLSLAERDGGCVSCGAPPGMCRVHHIDWWARDKGRTDWNNGVLLCETCHHLIHDNGWDIRVDGTGVAADVWLIPPAHIDPTRTPRPATPTRYAPAA